VLFEKVKTGIPGFDELVAGGVPKGYCYTIAGGPGSGKTTFAMQFLYNGATKYGENGVYLTFDEPPTSIRASALNFGMNLEKLENSGKIVIVDASPIRMEVGRYVARLTTPLGLPNFNIDTVLKAVHEAAKKVDAERIVVDSLTSLLIQYSDPFVVRKETLSMIRSLSESGRYTSLLLSEMSEGGSPPQFKAEMFLSNGVILLHTIKQAEERIRAIEVIKMRGVNHSTKLHPFKITDKGIVVYPGERVFLM
jgi:KaiC/GvpD/RAD55 family RecA-like ATPase